MWKFLLLAAFISLGSGAVTRLGEKKCTYGPSYWCAKYSHAIECGAVEHCKANVWKSSLKANECGTCKEVLEYMHTILANNATQGLLIDAVEEVCNLLPSSYSSECKSLITTYGTEIVQVIAAYTSNPGELCSLMGMCKAVPFMKLPESMKPIVSRMPFFGPGPVIPQAPISAPSSSVECIICEFAMTKLEGLVTSKSSVAEIEAALDKVCSLLPSTVQNECTAFVNTYANQIIQLIVREASPKQVCTLLKLCAADANLAKAPKNSAIKSGVLCEVCQAAMGFLKTELSSNATESEVIAALESVCNELPASYRSTCDGLVSQYGKEIITLILAELSPDLVCKELGLCSSSGLKKYTGPAKVTPKKAESGKFCLVCQVAMGYIKAELSINSTEEVVVHLLDTVCSYLPSGFKTECDAIVTEYGEEILNLLLSDLDPSEVCKELHMCTTAGVKTFVKAAVVSAAKPAKANSGEFCQVCEVAMGYLKSVISSPSTENEIVAALESMCNAIPSSFKTECDSLVQQYGKTIITLLVNQLSPDLVCKELGLCTSSLSKKYQSALKLNVMDSVKSGALCEVCDLAMGYLKSTLSSAATEEEITKAVESLCTYLPSSVQSECDGLIEQYGKMIINLIVSELTPDQVCKSLGLCTSAKLVLY